MIPETVKKFTHCENIFRSVLLTNKNLWQNWRK